MLFFKKHISYSRLATAGLKSHSSIGWELQPKRGGALTLSLCDSQRSWRRSRRWPTWCLGPPRPCGKPWPDRPLCIPPSSRRKSWQARRRSSLDLRRRRRRRSQKSQCFTEDSVMQSISQKPGLTVTFKRLGGKCVLTFKPAQTFRVNITALIPKTLSQHNSRKYKLVEKFQFYYNANSQVYSYETHQSSDLHPPKVFTSRGHFSFRFRGIKLWNSFS